MALPGEEPVRAKLKNRFLTSVATMDTCTVARINGKVGHIALTVGRIESLLQDKKTRRNPGEVFVIVSSQADRKKLVDLMKYRKLPFEQMKIFSWRSLSLKNALELTKHSKYVFLEKLTNFTSVDVSDLENVCKEKHLTVTVDENEVVKGGKREQVLLTLKKVFGSYFTEFSFNLQSDASKSSQLQMKGKMNNKKVAHTPSVKLLRSIVNKKRLSYQVQHRLSLVKTDEQLLQLIYEFLKTPKDSVAFLAMLSLLKPAKSKKKVNAILAGLCETIECEIKENGDISAFDFVEKYKRSLVHLKQVLDPLYDAVRICKSGRNTKAIKAVEMLLLSMEKDELAKEFNKAANNVQFQLNDGFTWLDRIIKEVGLEPSKKQGGAVQTDLNPLTPIFCKKNETIAVASIYETFNDTNSPGLTYFASKRPIYSIQCQSTKGFATMARNVRKIK